MKINGNVMDLPAAIEGKKSTPSEGKDIFARLFQTLAGQEKASIFPGKGEGDLEGLPGLLDQLEELLASLEGILEEEISGEERAGLLNGLVKLLEEMAEALSQLNEEKTSLNQEIFRGNSGKAFFQFTGEDNINFDQAVIAEKKNSQNISDDPLEKVKKLLARLEEMMPEEGKELASQAEDSKDLANKKVWQEMEQGERKKTLSSWKKGVSLDQGSIGEKGEALSNHEEALQKAKVLLTRLENLLTGEGRGKEARSPLQGREVPGNIPWLEENLLKKGEVARFLEGSDLSSRGEGAEKGQGNQDFKNQLLKEKVLPFYEVFAGSNSEGRASGLMPGEVENLTSQGNALRENILNQLVKKLEVMQYPDKTEMKVQLKPEHLGEVTLLLTREEGSLKARLVAESLQVKGVLESGLSQIKAGLEGQNIKVAEINVTLNQEGEGGFNLQEESNFSSGFQGRERNSGREEALTGTPLPREEEEPLPEGINYLA